MTEVMKVEPLIQAPATVTPNQMLMAAVEKGADLDQMSKLMDLQDRWEVKQSKSEYLQAMSDFQANCPVIVAKKAGHNYKYAPLGDIISQVKDLLQVNGLSYRFEQSQSDNQITVTCVVSHRSGYSEQMTMSGAPDTGKAKSGIQATASTVTYLRRYTLTGALGIVTADEDSDGRVASSKTYEVATTDQVSRIYQLLEQIKMSEEKALNGICSKLNITVQNFAQLYKEQADFAIELLESKV